MKKIGLILLVDDDDIANFYNEDLLTGMNVAEQITIVNDGHEALEYLLKRGQYKDNTDPLPCLIFLDINMPKMNGFEFLDAYSQEKDHEKVKQIVCMLTTSLHHKDQEKAESYSEISAYLSKPLDEEKVQSIIEQLF